MSDRGPAIDAFLDRTEWSDWTRTPLAGDASARRYLRLNNGPRAAILMDAPPENGEDTTPFVEIAQLLTTNSFAAPQILAHDPDKGLLLLSDLGANDYVHWLAKHPSDEVKLYKAAADVLLRLETIPPPAHLGRMTPDVGADMVAIIGTHYSTSDTTDLQQELRITMTDFAPDASTLALRDYHAENLIWRSDKDDLNQVGLLDFQDAFTAPAGYDLASLLRDARRDVSPAVANDIIDYFSAQTKAKENFRTALACLGVQRNLRILGVFARLVRVIGKPRYLQFMPRVWSHIQQDLQDPALATLKQAVMDTVPAPTADYLQRLKP